MATPYALKLADPAATLESAGGKGASLARMAAAGLPVPDGFHITTAAYRRFVDENGLQPYIQASLETAVPAQPATLDTAAASIRDRFAAAAIPEDVAGAIVGAYGQLAPGNPAVAVRSSATAEDLPEASFAGQQETYLNVSGPEAVLDAVRRCWASLWTARAIGYRAHRGIPAADVALAVVVQKLAPAEAAGILFTANPLTGRRDEVVINAAWGLGEAVVGGLVSPDTVVADKASGAIKTVAVADKATITVTTATGTEAIPLTDTRRQAQVLTQAQVRDLVSLARTIEDLYSQPADIEWCRGDGHCYVLQARPITALPPEPAEWVLPNPKAVYARGSLAEHLPNAVSPLFGTLGLAAINKATAELSDLMQTNLMEVDYQYRVINGYVYMGFVMTAKFMWAMVKVTLANLGYMLGQGRQRWQEASETFAKSIAVWDEKATAGLPSTELLQGVRELAYQAGKYYTVIQSGTLPTATSSEMVFTRVYGLVRRQGDPEAAALLFGLDTVALRAEKSLFDLGMWIRCHPVLADFILSTPVAALAAAFGSDATPAGAPAAEWNEVRARFEKHLDEFGHTSYAFDFANPTPIETPEMILDAVKVYVRGEGSDPHARQREVAARRERTVEQIHRRSKLIPNRWFDKALKWALDTGPAREDSIADMGMGHTAIRRLLREVGRRLASGGALRHAEDVYWLVEAEVDELAAQLERGEALCDYTERVDARKAEWRRQMRLVPPPMLPATSRWAKMIPWSRENVAGNVIRGLGASTGQVTAPACVLFAPEDFGRMKPGSVLVAVTTTPAWTPLFAMASAVVTDIGGPLSHSSIVAREYGIPAVLATGVGTRRIQEGQSITVDGAAGTVTLH